MNVRQNCFLLYFFILFSRYTGEIGNDTQRSPLPPNLSLASKQQLQQQCNSITNCSSSSSSINNCNDNIINQSSKQIYNKMPLPSPTTPSSRQKLQQHSATITSIQQHQQQQQQLYSNDIFQNSNNTTTATTTTTLKHNEQQQQQVINPSQQQTGKQVSSSSRPGLFKLFTPVIFQPTKTFPKT